MSYALALGDPWDFRESLQSIAGERNDRGNQLPARISRATFLHPSNVKLRELQPTPGELQAAADLKALADLEEAAHLEEATRLKEEAHLKAAAELIKRRSDAKRLQRRKATERLAASKAALEQEALAKLLNTRNPNTRPPQRPELYLRKKESQ